jgi:hypothetical protein
MKPETVSALTAFCTSPVGLRLEGGHANDRHGRRDPVVVYNTAAIVTLTAGRSIPAR